MQIGAVLCGAYGATGQAKVVDRFGGTNGGGREGRQQTRETSGELIWGYVGAIKGKINKEPLIRLTWDGMGGCHCFHALNKAWKTREIGVTPQELRWVEGIRWRPVSAASWSF